MHLTQVEMAAMVPAESLHPAIEESVAPGSTISTDDWNGYCGVEKLGYVRKIVRRGTVGKLFYRLVQQAVALGPVLEGEIQGGRS